MANKKFIRQDIHKKKRLDPKWRRPRGSDSKLRLRMQARPIVSPGYGKKSDTKGLHRSGSKIIMVSAIKDLGEVNPKTDLIVISAKLGFRSKKALVEEAMKKGIKMLNIADPEGYLKKKMSTLEEKRAKKEEIKEKKKAKEEKKEEKSIEDTLSDEEKKKVEKKEIDRLLTKKF